MYGTGTCCRSEQNSVDQDDDNADLLPHNLSPKLHRGKISEKEAGPQQNTEKNPTKHLPSVNQLLARRSQPVDPPQNGISMFTKTASTKPVTIFPLSSRLDQKVCLLSGDHSRITVNMKTVNERTPLAGVFREPFQSTAVGGYKGPK